MNTPKPPPVVPTYQPPHQDQAASGFFNSVSQLQPSAQAYSQYAMPQIQQAAQGIVNNPYAAPQQQGVNQAAQYAGGTLAPQLQQGASALAGMGGQAAGYGGQALAAGFDPQSALYNRTQHQVSDQSNAINSMYGLNSSPYGAGVAGQNLSNFNIDWQNQQLARQGQAAGTFGALTNAANAGYGGAADTGRSAIAAQTLGAQLPYQNYQQNLQGNISALGSGGQAATQAQAPAQQFIQDFAQYLGIGQNATQLQNNANNQRFQGLMEGYQSNMSGLEGIGELAGTAAMFAFL